MGEPLTLATFWYLMVFIASPVGAGQPDTPPHIVPIQTESLQECQQVRREMHAMFETNASTGDIQSICVEVKLDRNRVKHS